MSHDLLNRKYATVAEIDEGSFVQVDGDFSCMNSHAIKKVQLDPETKSLFIACADGKHFLDGQIRNRLTVNRYYVGLYPVESPK